MTTIRERGLQISIDALVSENARLREALKLLSDHTELVFSKLRSDNPWFAAQAFQNAQELVEIAKAALGGNK